MQEDIFIELSKYGKVTEYWIVKPYQACLGGKNSIIVIIIRFLRI